LAGIGGAFGLKIMLRDFEAMAAGATSPPRFLAIHWPVGTIKYAFLPNGGVKPTGVVTLTDFSPILQPFKNKGLDTDMSLFWGLHDLGATNGAGGHEGGTPMSTTGTGCPGTRLNGGEADDGVAGGPSWDQIILNEVKDDPTTGAVAMTRPGIGTPTRFAISASTRKRLRPAACRIRIKRRTFRRRTIRARTLRSTCRSCPSSRPHSST
jgi:hypothetical protein